MNDQLPGCGTCLTYAETRLPTVIDLWFYETGQSVRIGSFMAGVHARHLAGLSIGVTA